jgi:nucleotide-binding universal stress UspA family protein
VLPAGLRARLRTVTAENAAEGLAQVAAAEEASLVVVGASERSGLGRIRPGFTAIALLGGSSTVPVAVAPSHYLDRLAAEPVIAVGFDGGPEARVALAWADQLAPRLGAELQVVAVHEPVALGDIDPEAIPTDAVTEVLRRHMRTETEMAVVACSQSPDPELVFRDGDPATELADVSASVDLLVLGSRGRGPARSVLLGSVSEEALAGARSPVVVVPRSYGIDAHPFADLSRPAATAAANH